MREKTVNNFYRLLPATTPPFPTVQRLFETLDKHYVNNRKYHILYNLYIIYITCYFIHTHIKHVAWKKAPGNLWVTKACKTHSPTWGSIQLLTCPWAQDSTISLSFLLPVIRWLLSPSFLPVSVSFFATVANFSSSMDPGTMQAFYGFSSIGPRPTAPSWFLKKAEGDPSQFPALLLFVGREDALDAGSAHARLRQEERKALLRILARTTWCWDFLEPFRS